MGAGLSGALAGPAGGWAGRALGSAELGEVAAAAAIGGTASELTGGKFANGAATAAFLAAVRSAARTASTGGGGIPRSGFVQDAEGNVVYSDEVRGPFVEADHSTVTDDFMAERGTDGEGNTLYHAGKDIVPLNADRSVRTDAYAISGTEGVVIHKEGATGFGESVVVVRTPKGNQVIYGHMESFAEGVTHGRSVTVGQRLGIIGNEGMTTAAHPTRGLHLHVEIRQGAVPFRGRRLGLR